MLTQYRNRLCSALPKKGRIKMKKFLIVVDMQKDFIDGSLGTKEAAAVVPKAAEKITGFDGTVVATLDTHFEDYLDTSEGKKLPVPHCIKGSAGWKLDPAISAAIEPKDHYVMEKNTFGSKELPFLIEKLANGEEFSVELIGLCTDICVISNALLLKAFFPENDISVDADCCAGVTPELHNAALSVIASCQCAP